MAADGQIVFEVTADGKHAIADIKEITRSIKEESKKWDDSAQQSANNINDAFSGMLKKLVAGFSAAKLGKALLDVSKEAIGAASALEEVQNVVDVTFGSSASQIDKWAKSAGTQFGLTETQAKKFTSTLGAMMKSSGIAGNEIVNMSTDLAGLAADMASFYNLDFDTAFQKIRSGISGETEPLKQLGINMSVANLNAYALQQGLQKTFDQMTQGEQTMLRYQYMMAATADAQGDFARTSDGYANSMRTLETNVENLKTKLGQVLLPAVSGAVEKLNEFLTSLQADPNERTVLDDFEDIDIKTTAKLGEIDKSVQTVKDYLKILSELFGGGEEGKTIANNLARMGINTKEAEEYLSSLGYSTEEIESIQSKWMATINGLVGVIPGLSSVINTETGALEGGITAVEDYVKAWEQGQKRIAALQALEAKRQAIRGEYGEVPELWAKAQLAQQQYQRALDQWNSWGNEKISKSPYMFAPTGASYQDEWNYLEALRKQAETANNTYEKRNKALEDSLKIVDDLEAAIGDYTEEEYEAANGSEKMIEAEEEKQEAIKRTAAEVQDAIKALDDYALAVRNNIDKNIDNVVKGFERIEDSTSKVKQKISDLAGQQAEFEIGSDEWKNLQKQIDELSGQLNTRTNLYNALDSQKKFLDTYLADIEKAQSLGLSPELLSALSDGSQESAEALHALVSEDLDPRQVSEIDALYKTVQDKKRKLSETLTEQQLSVDQVYAAMAEEAKKAVSELDLSDGAAENAGKTVAGIATGINGQLPSVKEAVDAILAELARLTGLDAISIGGSSIPVFDVPHNYKDAFLGSFASGLDYVPKDGFAYVHEGERILTAEENRIRPFNQGTSGIDYDAFGGLMRDNVKAGGNVYLDRRIVGQVISDQQGQSYRQLTRSGWQQ